MAESASLCPDEEIVDGALGAIGTLAVVKTEGSMEWECNLQRIYVVLQFLSKNGFTFISNPAGGRSWLQILYMMVGHTLVGLGPVWGETFKSFLPPHPLFQHSDLALPRRINASLRPRGVAFQTGLKSRVAQLSCYTGTVERTKQNVTLVVDEDLLWPPEKWHSINGPVLINWYGSIWSHWWSSPAGGVWPGRG